MKDLLPTSLRNRINVLAEISEKEVLHLYPFGSKVYGTDTPTSDYDFLLVSNSVSDYKELKAENINLLHCSEDYYKHLLNMHDIVALECYYLTENLVIKRSDTIAFELNLVQLRHSISAKSSNSWVKAKKKVTVEKDYDLIVSQKSLFHSLRIVDFGIQICKYKKIINYSSVNGYWDTIKKMTTWEEMKETFKPEHNRLLSEFRTFSPK